MTGEFGVEITIDRLRLAGYSPAERERLLGALRRELDRLARERGGPGIAGNATRESSVASLRVALGAGSGPEGAGERLAREIWSACAPAHEPD